MSGSEYEAHCLMMNAADQIEHLLSELDRMNEEAALQRYVYEGESMFLSFYEGTNAHAKAT